MAYYKIEKGTELFEKMDSFHDRIKEVKKPARELLESIPNADSETYYMDAEIAGGIRYVRFPHDKVPKDWCVSKSMQRSKAGVFCYPHGNRKSTKEIRLKIKNLPRLNYPDLTSIFGYKALNYKSNHWSFCPGINWTKDFILINVQDVEEGRVGYTPVEGMTEILASEYMKLKKDNNDDKQKN